jgi:CheY-like chemotaxis protein
MNPKTILIADDDHDFAELLAMRCRCLGLGVDRATTAAAALARIEYGKPDLACLDINMPPGNGLAVIEMIRGDARFSSMPILVVTGYVDQEAVRRCRGLRVPLIRKCHDGVSQIERELQQLVNPQTRELQHNIC